ncbi:MAG: DedA family protein [Deltaproteobacteria bacterium]|nr:DedA family protein [Deltaproteobacteria bacterium]
MTPEIFQTIAQMHPLGVYGFLFGAALMENLLPFLPGDMVTVFGGYLAGRGGVSFFWVWLASSLGNWCGFMAIYGLGTWLGRSRVHSLLAHRMPHGQLEKAEAWFHHYGRWVILFNRFLAGTRSVVSLFAGFSELTFREVAPFSLASAMVWCALLTLAGGAIGENWGEIMDSLDAYNRLFLTLAAVGLVGFLAWRRIRAKR